MFDGSIPSHSSGLRILLVEDTPVVQKALQFLLEALGCEVIVAGTGCRAFQWVLEMPHFDLILMDIGLPDMSGIVVTQLIHLIQRDIPIVGVSTQTTSRDACLSAGMQDFLEKPVMKDALLSLLDSCRRERRRRVITYSVAELSCRRASG